MNSIHSQPLLLGIDGGGTHCRAQLCDSDGTPISYGEGGPANAYQDYHQAIASILESAHAALSNAQLNQSDIGRLHVCLALAGVNIPSVKQQVLSWAHPFMHIAVISDLEAACLGAHNGKNGGLIICGTGSCGYANTQTPALQLGGHGFPIGDKASGAWLGLKAVEAALLDNDNLGEPTRLTPLIQAHFGGDSLAIVSALNNQTSTAYGQLARYVFDAAQQKDTVATHLITQAAQYIDQMAEQLIAAGAANICLLGGVSAPLTPYLCEHTRNALVTAKHQPTTGAIHYLLTHRQT